MLQITTKKKEIPRFIVTGILAVITDYLSYLVLVGLISIDYAKGTSFICGSVIAYILNKSWTFEHKSKVATSLLPFIILYTSTFFVNVSINHFSLAYITDYKSLAFLFATAASTILNFIGMKFWVFSRIEQGGT